jgi:hypothetical protein
MVGALLGLGPYLPIVTKHYQILLGGTEYGSYDAPSRIRDFLDFSHPGSRPNAQCT